MINTPSISVNKLAEYIVSRGARQRQILKDRKYPDDEFNLGMYHRDAAETVAQYIADGAIDPAPISAKLAALSQATPEGWDRASNKRQCRLARAVSGNAG